jgi:hypothetical protein
MVIRLAAFLTIAAFACIPLSGNEATAQEAKAPPKASQPAIRTKADARRIVLLIRSTFATVHQANISGNYSVFRDLAAPSLRASMSLVRLGDYFKPLREANADLSRALLTMPKFRKPPRILKGKFLVLHGFFPGENRIDFNLTYQRVKGRWRFVNVAIKPEGLADAKPEKPAEPAPKTSKRVTPPPPTAKPRQRAQASAPRSTGSLTRTTTISKSDSALPAAQADDWPLRHWYSLLPGAAQ